MSEVEKDDEEDEDLPVLPISSVASYDVWAQWHFFGKRIPPYAGGFLEWPEWLLNDLINIEAMHKRVLELKGSASYANGDG